MTQSPKSYIPEIAMSIRTAYFSSSEIVDVESAVGKVFAEASVSCPPAVPILVSGEIISAEAVNCLKYYGIDKCSVIEKK
jgi:arginine/lysine/ornithine decarboxylase